MSHSANWRKDHFWKEQADFALLAFSIIKIFSAEPVRRLPVLNSQLEKIYSQ